MRLFAGISYALGFVLATWVGLHLLRMAARTRKALELGIGLTVFTLGFGTAGMLGGELIAAGGRIILGQLLAITSASAIWCAFMPPSWFSRLAERFDANAAQRPVDASAGAKGSP